MDEAELNVVTGAFGYNGKYIARRLLAEGQRVVTLTRHPERADLLQGQVVAFPWDFDSPHALARHLQGATTLYNTYWVRFPRGEMTFEKAIQNSKTLIKAAQAAGIRRIVHISITNASSASPLPYFNGKGLVEEAIKSSGLSYAILRPTIIFGDEDILLNNIAWFLRRLPLFSVPGDGDYTVQPIYADDVADLAVRLGGEQRDLVVDAAGPETYTFEGLVGLLAEKIGSRARVLHVHPSLALLATRLAGALLRDVVLTGDEVRGLMSGLLVSDGPPAGQTRFSQWLEEHAETMGREYRSEVGAHYLRH